METNEIKCNRIDLDDSEKDLCYKVADLLDDICASRLSNKNMINDDGHELNMDDLYIALKVCGRLSSSDYLITYEEDDD